MKKILFLFLILINLSSFSQQWKWAFPLGGNTESWVFNIQTDSMGSPYFMGTCALQTVFTGLNGTYPTSGYRSFIASYTEQGQINWVSGGSGNARSASIDKNGNSYLTGGYTGTAFFGKQTDTLQRTSFNNSEDDFIVKLDSTGKAVFFNAQGGSCTDNGTSINCFGKDDIIVSGFDETYCNMAGNWTFYFKKIDSSGNLVWSLNPPISYFSEDPITYTKDNGFLLSGTYGSQPIKFAGLVDTIPFQGGIGFTDVFIAKYSFSGNVKWARTVNGKNYQLARQLVTDNSNNILFAVESLDTCYYDNTILLPKGDRTLHLIKIDSSGNYLNHISFYSSHYPPHFWLLDLKTDKNNNIYLATETDTTINIGITDLNVNYLPGEKAISIIKLDENFNYIWSQWITTLKWSNPAASIAVNDSIVYVGLCHDAPIKLNGSAYHFQGLNSTEHTSLIGALYNGSIPLNIKDYSFGEIAIFPNPSSGIFTIKTGTQKPSSVCVYDVLGNCVLTKTELTTNQEIDLSKHAKGIYFVEISSGNEKVVKKISLQ